MTSEWLPNAISTPERSSVDFGETDRRLHDLQAALEGLSRARSHERPVRGLSPSPSSGYPSSAMPDRPSTSPAAAAPPPVPPATPPASPSATRPAASPAQPPRREVGHIYVPPVGPPDAGGPAAQPPRSVPGPAPLPHLPVADRPQPPFVAEGASVPASAPIQSSAHPEPFLDVAAANERARAIVAEAEAEASRIITDANRDVAHLKRQIEDLIALRDRIERSVRGADSLEAGAEPPRTAPGWMFGSEPGTLSLTAGTFADLDELEQFERVLAREGALQDVYLRAWDSGGAVFELTISEPVPLVEELRRVSPIAFTVVHESAAMLSLELHSELAGEATT